VAVEIFPVCMPQKPEMHVRAGLMDHLARMQAAVFREEEFEYCLLQYSGKKK